MEQVSPGDCSILSSGPADLYGCRRTCRYGVDSGDLPIDLKLLCLAHGGRRHGAGARRARGIGRPNTYDLIRS